MTRFTAVTRCALGFAALGAGLLHLALAVGAAPWLAVLLIGVGAAEFLWGVLAVSRPGVPIPRVAIVGALAPPAGWVVLLLVGMPGGPRPIPMLAATLLDLVVAAGIAWALRRDPRPEPARPAVGIAVAGILVAVLAVPALIATEAVEGLPDLPPPHEQPAH